MSRLSEGQRKLLQEASDNESGFIISEVPEYWNPKPLKNDQIRRLVYRGFLVPEEQYGFFKITDAGLAALNAEVSK